MEAKIPNLKHCNQCYCLYTISHKCRKTFSNNSILDYPCKLKQYIIDLLNAGIPVYLQDGKLPILTAEVLEYYGDLPDMLEKTLYDQKWFSEDILKALVVSPNIWSKRVYRAILKNIIASEDSPLPFSKISVDSISMCMNHFSPFELNCIMAFRTDNILGRNNNFIAEFIEHGGDVESIAEDYLWSIQYWSGHTDAETFKSMGSIFNASNILGSKKIVRSMFKKFVLSELQLFVLHKNYKPGSFGMLKAQSHFNSCL